MQLKVHRSAVPLPGPAWGALTQTLRAPDGNIDTGASPTCKRLRGDLSIKYPMSANEEKGLRLFSAVLTDNKSQWAQTETLESV